MMRKFLPIVLLLIHAAHSSMVMAVNPSLDSSGSALWTGGNALMSDGDYLVTGHPNGMRVWRKIAPDQIRLVGQIELPNGVQILHLADSLVYGLDGAGRTFVANISDPARPSNLGSFGPDQEWTAMAMSGHFLFTAGIDSTIAYDLSNPIHPISTGAIAYNAPATAVAAHDSVVVIALGTGGLLMGIRHPDGALTAGGRLAGETVSEIVTDGSYAWSPQGDSGVLIVDVTNPASPQSITHLSTDGHAEHVALCGDRLLVADSYVGLISYRLITRPFPFWQSELNGISGVTSLSAESPSRFYAAQDGQLLAVDVDLSGHLSLGYSFGHRGGYGPVVRYRNWIFLASSTGMWRVDRSAPVADSNFVHQSANAVFGVVQAGDKLLTAEGRSGAALYRINDEGFLELLSRIQAETSTGGVVIGSDTLMVLDSAYGFQVYDFTNPYAPHHLGGRATDQPPPVGAIHRNFLYLAEPHSGVAVWNWEHVAKPELLRILPNSSTTEALLVDCDQLYVADRDSGLAIYSLVIPSNPALLSRMPPPFSPTALHRAGRFLYAGQSDGTISVIDIENLASPSVVAETKVSGRVRGLSKIGERLWVSTQSAVQVVAIGPPLLPGDFNDDGVVDVFDVVAMISYSFSGGEPPDRLNAADVNADGQINLIDIVLTIDFIFSGGVALLPGTVE